MKKKSDFASVCINLTPLMKDQYPIEKNRSYQLLEVMENYMNNFDMNNLRIDGKGNVVGISKLPLDLHNKIIKLIECGVALSRSELFRQAIMWDILQNKQVQDREIENQLEEEYDHDKFVRIPTEDYLGPNNEPVQSFKTYKIIKRLE